MKKILLFIIYMLLCVIIVNTSISDYMFYTNILKIFQEKFHLTTNASLIPLTMVEARNLAPWHYKQYMSNIIIDTANVNDSIIYQNNYTYYGRSSLGDSANRWKKLHVNYAHFNVLHARAIYIQQPDSSIDSINLADTLAGYSRYFSSTTSKYRLYILKNDSSLIFNDTTGDSISTYGGHGMRKFNIFTTYMVYDSSTSTLFPDIFNFNGYVEVMGNMIADSIDYYIPFAIDSGDIPLFYMMDINLNAGSNYYGHADTTLFHNPIFIYNSSGFSKSAVPIYLSMFSDIYISNIFDLLDNNIQGNHIRTEISFTKHFISFDVLEGSNYERNYSYIRLKSDRLAVLLTYTRDNIFTDVYNDTAGIILE